MINLDLFIVAAADKHRSRSQSCGISSVISGGCPDELDAPTLEPAKEGFQGGVGHRAGLVQDDHIGNDFLPHPFRRPLCMTTPAEEAVIGLGLDAPGPNLFGQTIGLGEDKGISLAKQLNPSRRFAAPSAAV